MREEDFPAQQPQAEEEARVPAAHAQPCRPGGPQEAAPEGALPPVGLIWRVRGRAAFRALSRGRRARSGVVTMVHVDTASQDPPRVAFAVPRVVGGSVERNRVRRRLRAAVAAHADLLSPGAVYLLGATKGVEQITFSEIEARVVDLMQRASGDR